MRYWMDPDGGYGNTLMKFPYGCIEGAVGADDEDVDVYLGPDETAQFAYVVHQNELDGAHLPECFANRGGSDTDLSSDLGNGQAVSEKFASDLAVKLLDAWRGGSTVTSALQGNIDSTVGNPELLRDRVNGGTSGAHRQGSLQVPEARTAMLSAVFGLAHDRQILGPVIKAILIQMVNDLVTAQWATKYALHDDTVLKALAGSVVDQAVACSTTKSADVSAFVLRHNPNNTTVGCGCNWVYSEDKVMLGFPTAAAAAAAYLAQYDDPRFFGGMDKVPMDELREIVTGTTNVGKIVGDPVVPPEVVQSALQQSFPMPRHGDGTRPHHGDDDTRRPPGKEINLEGYTVENTGPTGYPGKYAIGGDGNFNCDDPSNQGPGQPGM
jgi:hypothetical protein